MEETKAVARLPNVDIEIVHRQAEDGRAEQISMTLSATPDFRTAAGFLENSVFPQLTGAMMGLPFSAGSAAFPGAFLAGPGAGDASNPMAALTSGNPMFAMMNFWSQIWQQNMQNMLQGWSSLPVPGKK